VPPQQPASHRAARSPGAAARKRIILLAAGATGCAVLVLAIVTTLSTHRGPADAQPSPATGQPGPDAVADGSVRSGRVDPSMIAAPTWVARDARRHLASIGGAPELARLYVRRGSSPAPASTPAPPAPAPPAPAPSGTGPDPAHMAAAVFDAINGSRQAAGLRPLQWNSALQISAQRHNQAMSHADTLTHQAPGEADLGTRESSAGVSWWWAAENIGVSSELTEQAALGLEAAMVNEQPPNDGHRQNILSGDADSVGVDVLLDPAHNRMWLTEDFAQTP
jgi:uncharacterized protein YkwD